MLNPLDATLTKNTRVPPSSQMFSSFYLMRSKELFQPLFCAPESAKLLPCPRERRSCSTQSGAPLRRRRVLAATIAAPNFCSFFFSSSFLYPPDLRRRTAPIVEALGWVRNAPADAVQFDYVMTARVRLLFFWTGKDDVGGGFIRR